MKNVFIHKTITCVYRRNNLIIANLTQVGRTMNQYTAWFVYLSFTEIKEEDHRLLPLVYFVFNCNLLKKTKFKSPRPNSTATGAN